MQTNLEIIKYLVEELNESVTDYKTVKLFFKEEFTKETVLHQNNLHLDVVKYYVSKGMDTSMVNIWDSSVVGYAKNLEVAKFYVEECGAFIDNVIKNINDIEVIKYLVSKGCTYEKQLSIKHSKSLETVKFLVEKLKFGAYHEYLYWVDGLETIKYLVSKGLVPKKSELCLLSYANNLEIVKFYISQGVDFNPKKFKKYGTHPFVSSKNLEIAKYYVSLGVDLSVKDEKGFTLLHNARSEEMIDYLLSLGVDIDIGSPTPLEVMIDCDNSKFGKYFVERGAKVPAGFGC